MLTKASWWAICSHIQWKLKNDELTCWICVWELLHWTWMWLSQCHLSVIMDNSKQMPLVLIIKDPWSPTALSMLSRNAFHQVFPIHETPWIEWWQMFPQFQKWNVPFVRYSLLCIVQTPIIHVALSWVALLVFSLTQQMSEHNWYRSENFYDIMVWWLHLPLPLYIANP